MYGDATTVLGSIELTELHRIYKDVCNELDIVPTDEWRRDVVAAVVMDCPLWRARNGRYSSVHGQVAELPVPRVRREIRPEDGSRCASCFTS